MNYLWEHEIPGVTMRRGNAGIDEQGSIQYDILEDAYFNNLPIIIETVIPKELADKVKGGLKSLMKHGQISITKGLEEDEIQEHEYFVIKVYTRENKKKLLKKDEYEKILTFLQEKNVLWATVTKGIAGYGRDHVIYSQHLFPLSENLPLVIECMVEREQLSGILEELKQIVTDGVIFTLPVQVILNR
ncbi:DUF190 domain-containing protein [Aminipila luticellarii]|uniref:DUF190 domain-containing protein n=2 Tax=Aminipila luticellarii TaxID=2507160 RepID=A0A410PWY2_9FIRM|nr:DUF190 domain-containing protein [Aminipila luticellarii]